MAKLRLFAGLRDIAGVGSTEVDGSTVAEVLDAASARYGSAFSRGLANARVWVNGEEAEPAQILAAGDEVALIPPVSGGAGVLDRPAAGGADIAIPLILVGVLIVGNVVGDPAWWSAAVVAVVGFWIADIVTTVAGRGTDLPVLPGMGAVVVAVASVWTLGIPGLALAVVGAVMLPLLWAVASDSSRILTIISPVVVMSLVAVLATGSLMLATVMFEDAIHVIGVFLVVAFATTAVGLLIERFTHLPFGDPFSATALTAVLASVVSAALWKLDLVSFLIAGLVAAVALVGGRGFGSVLRTRRVVLIDRAPGATSMLDGVLIAAPLFIITLRLIAN